VGRHAAPLQLWDPGGGRLRVTIEDVSSAIAGEDVSARIPEEHTVVQASPSYQGTHRRHGLWPQRTDAVLVALASYPNLSPSADAEIFNGKCKNLGDARARIEEQQEERVITNARGRAAVGLCQDRTNLLGLEVGDHATASALRTNGQDALVLAGARDVASEKVLNEPMDCGEPAVTRGGRVTARRLEVVEERENSFHADVVELEAGDVAPRAPG
jgi:hypothetical protein